MLLFFAASEAIDESVPQDPQAPASSSAAGNKGRDPEHDICKICMDAAIDCILLECGHMVTCTKCGKRLADCPICRQYVTRVVHVFRSWWWLGALSCRCTLWYWLAFKKKYFYFLKYTLLSPSGNSCRLTCVRLQHLQEQRSELISRRFYARCRLGFFKGSRVIGVGHVIWTGIKHSQSKPLRHDTKGLNLKAPRFIRHGVYRNSFFYTGTFGSWVRGSVYDTYAGFLK